MEKHISFEEMSEFIFSEKFNNEFIEKCSNVYSHIRVCPKCRELYDSMVGLTDALECSAAVTNLQTENEKIVLRALNAIEATSAEMKDTLMRWMSNLEDLVINTKVTVKNFSEIVVSNKNYTYPGFAAYVKSASNKSDEVMQTGTVRSSVVDGDSNRISIGLDGTLSLYFNKEKCDEKAWVLLAPTDNNNIPYFKQLEKYDNNLYIARFFDITPGDYLVILQN